VWISSTVEDVQALHSILSFGRSATKPVVAAIQGAALGIGAGLVAGAHVGLAAQGTSFGLTEVRVGQWPFLSWDSIERSLGSRRALELSLTGRVFNAADALSWGLIHEITQPSELEDRAFATASVLAAAPPGVVRAALAWSREPGDASSAFLANLRSAEAAEGAAAFVEKRRPQWPPLD
jgi:enoyl-CoA hydratase/carnithine racemase